MYAKRNSLTILIFLVLLSGLGFLWYRSEATELSEVLKKNREMGMQLHGSLEIAETLVKIQHQRDSLQASWEKAPKKILNADEPAFSLSYINWLIHVHNLDLDFDFYLNDKKVQNEFTTFSYTLSGEGDYRNICSLLWYITYNPLLYHIKSVNFKRSDKDDRLLNFVIMFEGYSMNKDWEVGNELAMVSRNLDWDFELGYDAFAILLPVEVPKPAPVRVAPLKPQEDPSLIDVERAGLLAITNDTAFLRARDGKVVSLKVGDRVRRGIMTRLDQRNNYVEFQLEADGVSRPVRLNIEYN
jgi:Tfp pilus assembly protein PilO